MGKRVLSGKAVRAIFTPALGALTLVGGLAVGVGSFATQAHAEDAADHVGGVPARLHR